MGWVYTILASTGELAMLWGLKKQSTRLMILSWAVGVLISGHFLNRALQLLDSSSVYPMWVSIGAIGSLIMGARMHGEVLSRRQCFFVALLAVSCAGLYWEGH